MKKGSNIHIEQLERENAQLRATLYELCMLFDPKSIQLIEDRLNDLVVKAERVAKTVREVNGTSKS